MQVIEVDKVTKYFGKYRAVAEVSFSAGSGRIFGLLGPNGAGKTTTIRMMNDILIPDSGEIRILGEPVSAKMQNNIGYLPEERGLYKRLKVIEQLQYFGKLKGLSHTDATKRAKMWLHEFGAKGWEQKKIQELSKGMQQKVQFISTILHDPEVLILDEPFAGFDPINTELLKTIILDLKKAGKTLILSTHVMSQVEELCDDICLINKGKAVLEGNVRDIKTSYGRDSGVIEFEGDDSFLNELEEIKILSKTSNRAEFRMSEDIDSSEILKKAMEKSKVLKFELTEPSLHEIFIDTVSSSNIKSGEVSDEQE